MKKNSDSHRKLFICTTQFHVFNCMNLSLSLEGEKDLYVLNFGANVLDKLNIPYLSEIFAGIKTIDLPSMNQSRHKAILSGILGRSVFGFIKNSLYADVYISGTDIFSRIIAMKFWKKGARIHYYEDGLESYLSILKEEHKHKQDTLLKAVFGKRCLDASSDLYVYEPKLVINNTFNRPVYPISKQVLLSHIQQIAQCFKEPVRAFDRDIIFLTAWFNESDKYDEQLRYIDLIRKDFEDDLSVKIHPSDNRLGVHGKYHIENCGNFELANGMYDMSGKIYVSLISTACITPILLYDRIPYVIFLYKIFMDTYPMPNWAEADRVLTRLIETKKLEDRVYIPETIQEYEDLLNKLVPEVRRAGCR